MVLVLGALVAEGAIHPCRLPRASCIMHDFEHERAICCTEYGDHCATERAESEACTVLLLSDSRGNFSCLLNLPLL